MSFSTTRASRWTFRVSCSHISWKDTAPTSSTSRRGSGSDTIIATYRAESIYGSAGADSISGNGGDDLIYGDDPVSGEAVAGVSYDDTIYGGAGYDTIYGGFGNDRIDGGDNGDVIMGGDGDDWIMGSSGADTIDGQGGNNVIDYYYSPGAVHVDLNVLVQDPDQPGWAAGDKLSGIHDLYGSYFGNDTLIGSGRG